MSEAKKVWVRNNEFQGLFIRWQKGKKPKTHDGVRMKFVCDDCGKKKQWRFPDVPKEWKQYDDGGIYCPKCEPYNPMFDPHRTGASKYYV